MVVNSKTALHPFDVLLEIDRRSRGRSDSDAAAPQAAGTSGRLALRLGQWHLMFLMEDVSEIIPLPSITRVPGVKPWLLGIANLRGTVITVMDLQRFLSGKATAVTNSSRVVVIGADEWDYGLLIDEVIGMRHFGTDSRLHNVGAVDAHLRPYLTDAFNSDGKLWLTFNVSRLFDDPNFLNAAA